MAGKKHTVIQSEGNTNYFTLPVVLLMQRL